MRGRTLLLLVSLALPVFAQEPAPQFQTGLKFLDPAQYAGIALAAPKFGGVLPPAVDLAPFADPGNQGRQASCVAWAVAYDLKTFLEERKRRWGVATAEHQFSPAYVYNQIRTSLDCLGGTNFPKALDLLQGQGVVSLAEFPYDDGRCDALPDERLRRHAAEFKISSYERVATGEMQVKTLLAAGYPVIIGMPVDRAFMKLRGENVWQGLSGPELPPHAMVITGYDDDRTAFKLINSWGRDWCNHGTCWISYRAFENTVQEAYVVEDVVPEGPKFGQKLYADIETTVLASSPAGVRSTTKTTADHHCSANCEGEPTRTNYQLTIAADEGTYLKSPQLKCVAGPCPWSAVLYARIENDGKRAVGSWDVWGHPTTWELTAEEVRIGEVSRFVRQVEVGEAFIVAAGTGDPAPKVAGKLPSGEAFSFVAGQPIQSPYLQFTGYEIQGQQTLYRYEWTKKGQ